MQDSEDGAILWWHWAAVFDIYETHAQKTVYKIKSKNSSGNKTINSDAAVFNLLTSLTLIKNKMRLFVF